MSKVCMGNSSWMKLPANSRSEFKIVPFEFVEETNSSVINCGHSRRKIKGLESISLRGLRLGREPTLLQHLFLMYRGGPQLTTEMVSTLQLWWDGQQCFKNCSHGTNIGFMLWSHFLFLFWAHFGCLFNNLPIYFVLVYWVDTQFFDPIFLTLFLPFLIVYCFLDYWCYLFLV